MKRSTLVIFGLFAALCLIALPVYAILKEGGEDASPQKVSSELTGGKDLFITNCGACHTLAKAGTDGVVGPDLDDLLAPPGPTDPDPDSIKPRVLAAVQNGLNGRMPAGILSGAQADEVSDFVSQVAGQ